MIGAIVGDYFGGSYGLARHRDPARRRHLRVRARLGGDRRRECPRDPVLRGGRGRRAARDALAALRHESNRPTTEEERMKRGSRWFWLGAVFAALVLGLAACGGDDDEAGGDATGDTTGEISKARQGHPAAQVGDAGPVRRLLRGRGRGLLRGRGTRRHAPARRPGHRPRAGRPGRPGRVRRQLARQHARDPRQGPEHRQHRAGLHAQRHDRGDVEGHGPRLDPEAEGQEGRRLARRERAQAVRRAEQERPRPAEGRAASSRSRST